ncbi:MAG: hypothetical protein GC164_11560 [Phycisphaera sp.]|nr:hypothetical protein [Phycisphaera sp.]
MVTRSWTACVAFLFVGALGLCPVRAADLDDTGESAAFMLEQAMRVDRSGQHHTLLRALRHTSDPDLLPFFSRLAEAGDPSLRVHGILGMADCDPQRRLDLVRLAKLEPATLQADIVSFALDDDLLGDEQAMQLVNWPGLDSGVKVVVIAHLMSDGKTPPRAPLDEALKSDKIGRRSLAAMLLYQLGEESAMKELVELNNSELPERDDVRALLLSTALTGQFDRLGPWALGIATEAGVNPRVGLMALQLALKLGIQQAQAAWQHQFESSDDPAQRVRLSLCLLQQARFVPASLFDVMVKDTDAQIAAMGQVGQAIAGKGDIASRIAQLVKLDLPIANEWALSYVRHDAPDEVAIPVLVSVIEAYDPSKRIAAQLLDDSVAAAQMLFERSPEQSQAILVPVITNPQADGLLVQAILLGLIRVQKGNPAKVIDGIEDFHSPAGERLALILRAKNEVPLNAKQMDDLSLIVRGGGGMSLSVRIQAAWAYLHRTGQTRAAIARALANS